MKQIVHDCVAQSPDTMKFDEQHLSIWLQSEKQCFYAEEKKVCKLNKLFMLKRWLWDKSWHKLISEAQNIHAGHLQLATNPKCVRCIFKKHNLSQNWAQEQRRFKRYNAPLLTNVLQSFMEWSNLKADLTQKGILLYKLSEEKLALFV